jgi:hypothetical protein
MGSKMAQQIDQWAPEGGNNISRLLTFALPVFTQKL